MPVESAADLAGMFDADEFGDAAAWGPGWARPWPRTVEADLVALTVTFSAATTTVNVILDQPDADSAAFGVGVRAATRMAMLPRAALPQLLKSDFLLVGPETLTVAAVRRAGPDGALWEAEC